MRFFTKAGIIFMFSFLLTITVYGQRNISFGLKSGISSSTFYSSADPDMTFEPRWSVIAGVWADIHLVEVIHFQPEFVFVRRGSVIRLSEADPEEGIITDSRVEWQTSYLEVPLLLRVIFPYNISLAPHLVFGPSLNFLTGWDISPDNTTITENSDVTQTFDLATIFGIGTTYNPGFSGKFFFDIRYTLGTTIMYEFTGTELKNTGLTINVGYQF